MFLILLPVSSALIAVFLYQFLHLFSHSVLKLVAAFSCVREGDFDTVIDYRTSALFVQLYSSFNYTIAKIRSLVRDNLQQKILMQQMEDYKGIQEMSTKLSQYYQYTTRSNQDAVRLEEEYRFISFYADIQSIRFNGCVTFSLMPLPENTV